MDLDTLKGTVQGYFDRAFVEVAEKDYETPLANSDYGVKAKLAPNTGAAELLGRRFEGVRAKRRTRRRTKSRQPGATAGTPVHDRLFDITHGKA